MINGYKFILAPPIKNRKNATSGGIGFILSPHAQSCYIDHHIVSDRIMSVSFSGDIKFHVITCHAPTNVSTDEEIKTFFNELSEVIMNETWISISAN